MPPHCDSLDGPVVNAARDALTTGNVDLILPFVPGDGEAEVCDAFDLAVKARVLGGEAADVADRWFFETAVRIHRAGEGAPYTGLKPAGIDVGPVIPLAERAIATGSPEPVARYLTEVLHDQLKHRLEEVNTLAATKDRSVPEARAWVEAMLGFQVYTHHLLQALRATAHGEHGNSEQAHEHDHG